MGGQLRSQHRWQTALGIFTVGHQDQDPGSLGTITQFFYSQPDGITDGRAITGHARDNIINQVVRGLIIKRHRRQHERLTAKHHNADAITLAGLYKTSENTLDHCHPANLPALDGKIQGIHGARGIDCQHQVITFGTHLRIGFQQLRTHQANNQCRP